MSTKPTDSGRFAVDGSNVNAANISAPSSGLRDTGFPNNYVPPASEFNYLENIHYRWQQWLSDGDVVFNTINTVGRLNVGGTPITTGPTTFTADNTTEIFTSTVPHSLVTGDGPIRVSNSGGALPTGLVAATDYWVINLTATTFQLASSFANSQIPAPINITTNGTGTQTLASTAFTVRPAAAVVTASLQVNGVITGNAGIVTAAGKGIAVGGDAAIAGNETVAGTLGVTGPATLATLGVTGTATVATLGITGTATVATLAVTGNATVGGTLAVTGAFTAPFTNNISAANAQLTSTGLASTATFDGTAWILSTSGGGQGPVFDVPLRSGATLTNLKGYINKTSASGTILMTGTVRNMLTGATVITITAGSAASSPGRVTLSGSPTPLLILDGYHLSVAINGGGTSGDSVAGIGVSFT